MEFGGFSMLKLLIIYMESGGFCVCVVCVCMYVRVYVCMYVCVRGVRCMFDRMSCVCVYVGVCLCVCVCV